jgi:cytochrome c oxidase subunit 3
MAKPPGLGLQYETLEQQQRAYSMGMWSFLGSEVMLFGALFLAYTVGRIADPGGFAQASHQLHRYLGGLNTAVLLSSSTTMALAVEACHRGKWTRVSRFLLVTAALGGLFLGIKAYEWSMEFTEGLVPLDDFAGASATKLFFWFYFVMTGLHALHLTIGVAAVLLVTVLVVRRSPRVTLDTSTIVMLGLYWHLVDVIWFFLYPALYLIGGPS